MPNRPSSSWLWLLLAFTLGAALVFTMVPVLARTAAIAAPANLFTWSKGHGLLPLARLSWDTFIVYGLSIALPAAAALLAFFRLVPAHRIAVAGCLGSGILFSVHFAVPLYYGEPTMFSLNLPWWQHGLVVSLLFAFGLAIGLSRIFRIASRPGGRRTGAA